MSDNPYLTRPDPDDPDQRSCQMCDEFSKPPVGQTMVLVSAPADTGPFTDVEESIELYPSARWDVPLCLDHARDMMTIHICASCKVAVFAIDAMTNGSTVILCRPCNHAENANLMPGAGSTAG